MLFQITLTEFLPKIREGHLLSHFFPKYGASLASQGSSEPSVAPPCRSAGAQVSCGGGEDSAGMEMGTLACNEIGVLSLSCHLLKMYILSYNVKLIQ